MGGGGGGFGEIIESSVQDRAWLQTKCSAEICSLLHSLLTFFFPFSFSPFIFSAQSFITALRTVEADDDAIPTHPTTPALGFRDPWTSKNISELKVVPDCKRNQLRKQIFSAPTECHSNQRMLTVSTKPCFTVGSVMSPPIPPVPQVSGTYYATSFIVFNS